MTKLARFAFGSLCLAATLAACGGSTSTGSAPIPLAEFPARFAAAICDNIGSCCQTAGLAYDAAACKSAIPPDTVTSDKVVYDANKAGECVSWVVREARSCLTGAWGSGPCDGVFTGTVPPGGACTDPKECLRPTAGTAECDRTAGTGSQGTCVQQPRGGLGDLCDRTCDEHDSQTTCATSIGTTAGASGAATAPVTCYVQDSLYCDASGHCAPLAALGAPCQMLGCVAGAFCESTGPTGVCAPQVPVGEACAQAEACQAGSYCDESAARCVARKAVGQSCTADEECAAGSRCSAGKCSPGLVNPTLCSGTRPVH